VIKQTTHFSPLILIALVIVTAMNWGCARSGAAAVQPKDSTIPVAGIHANVTIQRDERGVPYIDAANQDDLYFAQGYVSASDRLWQMDLLRRTASGELAEILGSSSVDEDKHRRAYGFARLAEQMVDRLSPAVRAELEAYAQGVNEFIKSARNLPPEFAILQYKPRLWRPADSLLIGKLLAETLGTTWQTDVMRAALAGLPPDKQGELLPTTSPMDLILVGSDKIDKRPDLKPQSDHALAADVLPETLNEIGELTEKMSSSLERVGLYAEDLAASNNWVVNGRRSATGKPLLANDPHLRPSAPSIWYMVHLTAPGLHAAGVTIPGDPGVLIGHNDWIAWGITNVEADVQDVYLERFDKDDPQRYLTAGGWREAATRSEEIKVRKGPSDPSAETVRFDVTTTQHGPVIFEQEGARYALRWSALDPSSNEFEAYHLIDRARDWKDFTAALSSYTGFPLNFVYADVEGHIGFWAAGRYPLRKTGRGTVPYDGATGEGDWTGYVPFESTPHVFDPASGIIVTANNRLVGVDYPYYITDNWAAPYRARRIYDLLTSKERSSVDDFREIQADTYSYPDSIFAAAIVKMGGALSESSPDWRDMVAVFEGGDVMMSPDSRAAALSAAMRDAFQRRVLAGTMGSDLAEKYTWSSSAIFISRIITTQPREWLPKDFDSYEDLVLACYKDAVDYLRKRLGADRSGWTWGRISQARFQHPLAKASSGGRFAIDPVPQGGSNFTVNRGAQVSMRFIADVSNWDTTRQGIPLGESGDPESPHWKDQIQSWRSVAPPLFPFSRHAVTNAAKETMILVASGAQ
jgi:penicillin amidase